MTDLLPCLIAFLRTRLDEDAHAARERTLREWPSEDHHPGQCDRCDRLRSKNDNEDDSLDPVADLRDVEGKRQIVDMWARWLDGYTGDDHSVYSHAQDTLKLLVRRYATHPDYRQGWRP